MRPCRRACSPAGGVGPGSPCPSCVKDPCSWGCLAKFNKFVNHLLFFCDLRPLEEFDFTTYPGFPQCLMPVRGPLESVRYLDTWIRYALMRKVRVLRVRVHVRRYELPRLCNMPLISQHLVTLELSCVVLDGCSMDFSRCPLLEDLKIDSCRISAHKMLSQSIRHLCITSCEFPDDATRLQIFAPNLFALKLRENKGLTPFLGSMPLLVTAFVGLCHCWVPHFSDRCRHTYHGDYCGLDPCIDCYGSEKCVVLGGLSNATSLQLKIIDRLSWEVCLHFFLVSMLSFAICAFMQNVYVPLHVHKP